LQDQAFAEVHGLYELRGLFGELENPNNDSDDDGMGGEEGEGGEEDEGICLTVYARASCTRA
jgi:hypothetical protein